MTFDFSTKILLVEDEPVLGESVKESLEEDGHTVTWVTDLDQIIPALQEKSHDLIFLDVMLPSGTSYETLKIIKATDSEFRKIPVIMLTNLGQIGEMDKAMNLGATDYVIKSNADLDKIKQVAQKHLTHVFGV